MSWDTICHGTMFKRQKVKFPQKCAITMNFDESRIVGEASNFRNTTKGIIADLSVDKKYTDTIAPQLIERGHDFVKSMNLYISTDIEVKNLAFVPSHANKKNNGNMSD